MGILYFIIVLGIPFLAIGGLLWLVKKPLSDALEVLGFIFVGVIVFAFTESVWALLIYAGAVALLKQYIDGKPMGNILFLLVLVTIGLMAQQNGGAFGILFILGGILFLVYLLLKAVVPSSTRDDEEKLHPMYNPPQYNSVVTTPSFDYEIAQLFNVMTPLKAVVTEELEGVDIGLFKGGELEAIVRCVQLPEEEVLPSTYIRELSGAKERADVQTAYLVTTVAVSHETRRAAAQKGIKVIDGVRLKELRANAKKRLGAKQG